MMSPIKKIKFRDNMFRGLTGLANITSLGMFTYTVGSLGVSGWQAINTVGTGFFGGVWNAGLGVFGAVGPLAGTLVSSAVALGIAVPLALATAVFMNEYCPPWLRRPLEVGFDMMSAIPSVIFGLVGAAVIMPLIGAGALSAGLVLSCMIFPTILSSFREALKQTPPDYKELAHSRGLTIWEKVKNYQIPAALPALVAGVMLGMARAFGETIAVSYVIGNVYDLPKNLFLDKGATLTTTLVNFPEAGALESSAMSVLALVLMGGSLAFNAASRFVVSRLSRSGAGLVERTRELVKKIRPQPAPQPAPVVVVQPALSSEELAARFAAQLEKREKRNRNIKLACMAATFLAAAAEVGILGTLVRKAIPDISLDLFLYSTGAVDSPRTGILNAIYGSAITVLPAAVIGTAVGILGATHRAIYAARTRAGNMLELANDTMLSVPTLINGLMVYSLMVVSMGGKSGLAGMVALASIAAPIAYQNSLSAMRQVEKKFYEVAHSRGLPGYAKARDIIWPIARSAFVACGILVTARLAGEAAPLLHTIGMPQDMALNPADEVAALTTTIKNFSTSNDPAWQRLVYPAALCTAVVVGALHSISQYISGPARPAAQKGFRYRYLPDAAAVAR